MRKSRKCRHKIACKLIGALGVLFQFGHSKPPVGLGVILQKTLYSSIPLLVAYRVGIDRNGIYALNPTTHKHLGINTFVGYCLQYTLRGTNNAVTNRLAVCRKAVDILLVRL